jgi:iron complex transport system substrate-binding protein
VEAGAGAVRERLLAHLQRLDAAFHNRWPAGQLLSRPESEVNWVGLFTDVGGHTSGYIAAVIAVSVFLFAAMGPDMIVGTDFDEEVYDRLSEIAPTVLVERGSNGDWRRRFLEVAEAVGRTERAEEVEADYERMISELPEVVRDTTVAFIRPDNGQFRIDSTAGAFPGSVAEDAGVLILDAPEGVGEFAEEFGYVTVSGELLDVVSEAGLIVVPDFRAVGDESDSVLQFERNPLWERLPAVREGRVLQVPGLVYNGGNHYAAELLLREIEQALT